MYLIFNVPVSSLNEFQELLLVNSFVLSAMPLYSQLIEPPHKKEGDNYSEFILFICFSAQTRLIFYFVEFTDIIIIISPFLFKCSFQYPCCLFAR